MQTGLQCFPPNFLEKLSEDRMHERANYVQGSTYRRALDLVKAGLTYRERREHGIEAGGRVIYCSGSPFF